MEPVKDMHIVEKFSELLKQMSRAGGFQGREMGIAFDILKEMVKEKEEEKCKIFLSFPACIISTGTRGVIKELVKRKIVDVIVTTAGTIDHDLARLWKNYYSGEFDADDKELAKKNIHRLGNVFIPQENYGLILEQKLQGIFKQIEEKEFSTYELLYEIGKRLESDNTEESILYWATKNDIPIILPGPYDGAFGYQLWMFQQEHNLKLNLFLDEQFLSEMIWQCKKEKIKTAALIIGGGISKHHVIWWNQFKEGLEYAIYITTAIEEDGSLSGAETREAISWHKIKQKAKHVTVHADATIVLPVLINALFEK